MVDDGGALPPKKGFQGVIILRFSLQFLEVSSGRSWKSCITFSWVYVEISVSHSEVFNWESLFILTRMCPNNINITEYRVILPYLDFVNVNTSVLVILIYLGPRQ